jgi:hypothetical protein
LALFTRKLALQLPLVVSMFTLVASCGHKAHGFPAHLPFAYMQEDCGPTDGIALTFYFTAKEGQPGKYEQPFIEIMISEGLSRSAPRDYTIQLGQYAVLASRCSAPAKCDAATSGTLHLSTFTTGKGATGEYELHFYDGTVEKGSFDAIWVIPKPPLACG